MRTEELYLKDIIEASDLIAEFLREVAEKDFIESNIIRSAVSYQLTIIGEASSKITERIRRENVDIPWKSIIGFRSIVVHSYFSVYWQTVWNTAKLEVPHLRERIFQMLESRNPDSPVAIDE